MRMTVGQLREFFRRGVAEAKIGASAEYMKKERVREVLQQAVVSAVASGDLQDDKDLETFFGASDMALKALKMIPFKVWQKLAQK